MLKVIVFGHRHYGGTVTTELCGWITTEAEEDVSVRGWSRWCCCWCMALAEMVLLLVHGIGCLLAPGRDGGCPLHGGRYADCPLHGGNDGLVHMALLVE